MPQFTQQCSERIMVTGDDAIIRQSVTGFLNNAGYQTLPVHSGRFCLAQVDAFDPHLILVDIVGPFLDGIETCRQLKADESTSHIPVIFVTGDLDDATLGQAFHAGAHDYVRKPVHQVELLVRVRAACNQMHAVRTLAEEEKLKDVLEKTGGICHELNQPLQYVLGAVQILMMDIPPEDPAYKNLGTILRQVEQMGDITQRLAKITHYRSRKYAGDADIIDTAKSISGSQATGDAIS